jgi:hypothetical protein
MGLLFFAKIFITIWSRYLPNVAAAAAIVVLNNTTAKTVVPEYYHQIKKNGINGARSTYGGEEKCMQSFGGGNLRKRDHLDAPVVDGRMIL